MITVNAMGDKCPVPVIKTKKAMQALTGPETIEVLVDNEISVQNVTKMASSSRRSGDVREARGEGVQGDDPHGGRAGERAERGGGPASRMREGTWW